MPQAPADSPRRYPHALPRLMRSLRTRALCVVLLLVGAPLILTGYLIQLQVQSAMARSLVRDTLVLTDGAAHAVAPHVASADQAAVAAAVEHLLADRRVAFVLVCDGDDRVITYRLNDDAAWAAYTARRDARDPTAEWGRRDVLVINSPDVPMLVIRREAVTAASVRPGDAGAAEHASAGAIGYVELGMMNPERERLAAQLRSGTIGTTAAVCLLCVPAVLWWVRGWTVPLRRLAVAAVALGRGRDPEPLPEDRRDEIGLLNGAFNAMAVTLIEARRSLVLANKHLERKVAERTRQIEHANSELERMLDRINRTNAQLQREIDEKDQFISAVTHDLGAPLRNIDGLTRILIAKHAADMESEALGKLERIAANVKQETELLNDLLDLSRIKSRRGRLVEVDLNELVDSVVGSLSYDIERARVKIVMDRRLPAVRVERNRLRQVFQNLIDNAVKYMPEQATDRRVHIGCTGEDDRVVFYVADTGGGIAPSDQQRVFQIFRRARYSGNRGVEGKGVGLAAVRAILDCYGGRIWVESDPPHGARFRFTLDPAFMIRTAAAPADG